jgi:hypothetical protein
VSPEQALGIVRRICEGVSLSWTDHQTIQQALAVLEQEIAPAPRAVRDDEGIALRDR